MPVQVKKSLNLEDIQWVFRLFWQKKMIHLTIVFVALRKYSIIKLLQSSVRLISLLHLAVIACVICAVIFLVKN